MPVQEISRAEADRLADLVGLETAIKMTVMLPIERVRLILFYNELTDQQVAQKAALEDPGAPFRVTIPGYEDIVHLTPEATLNSGEMQLIREVRKAYDPFNARRILIDMIGERKLNSYDKRVNIARRISASPTPEIVRDIGAIMTAIDNVQDGLITMTYLMRVIAPLVLKIAPKLLAKAVPVVGWISLAADILDLLQIIKWLMAPRATAKRGLKNVLEFSSRARGAKLLKVGRLKDLLPSFAEGIQVAQTTDYLFGYGVSLGPVYGVVEDSIAGAVRYSVPGGKDVTVDATPLLESDPVGGFKDLLWDGGYSSSPRESLYNRPLNSWEMTALSVLRSAPYTLQLGPLLPLETHVSTLAAVHLAQELLNRSGVLEGKQDVHFRLADSPVPAPRVSGTVRALLDNEIETLSPAAVQRPLPVGGSVVSPRLRAAMMAPLVVEGLRSSFEADKRNPLTMLAGHFITESAPGLLRLYGGTDVEVVETVRPEFKPLYTLTHWDLVHRLKGDRGSLERVLGALGAKYIESGRDQLTYDETVALVDLVDGFEFRP